MEKGRARTVAPLKMDDPGLLLWWTIYQSATRQSWLMTTRRIVLDTGVYLLILLRLNTTHLIHEILSPHCNRPPINQSKEKKIIIHPENEHYTTIDCVVQNWFTSCSTYPFRRHVLVELELKCMSSKHTTLVSCIRHANFLTKDH